MVSLREKIGNFVESDKVQNFIVALIMLNALTMGLETFSWWNALTGKGAVVLDRIFVWIFVAEIVSEVGIKRLFYKLKKNKDVE